MGEQAFADILIFGEALVDFLPLGRGKLRHVDRFEKTIGGAPANLAVGLARLGVRPVLVTALGEDEFGHFLVETLEGEGVDMSAVRMTSEAKTGIAFIALDHDGERSFLFFREPSADMTVGPEDAARAPVDTPMLHMGTNAMTNASGLEASVTLMRHAQAAGRLVSMDANIRLHLWPKNEEALDTIRGALAHVDLLKVSEEEMALLCPGCHGDPHAFYDYASELGVRWVVMTLGADGARVFGPGVDVAYGGRVVEVVDTTGAGDAFLAGLLFGLVQQADREVPSQRWPDRLSADSWRKALRLANHLGSEVCTALGATTRALGRHEVPWEQLGWTPLD